MFVNKLILGDNLEKLKEIESESVDLIYLDPPFYSNREYEVFWGDDNEKRSFDDRWEGGMHHYISWLKGRVMEMHRILKPTGSIFLHCDWHANAYIRVEILDKVFGANNLVNEIIWCYAGPGNVKNRLAQKHDMIYFYAKSDNYYFDADSIRMPYNEETIARTNRGASKTGIMASVKGNISERHKNRLNESGKYPEDYWVDIPRLQGNGAERIGYPTQKPEALLERIIKCATNEGDTVLDPFVGGGTTVAVADRLNRKWIGIDVSISAISVSDLRLQKQKGIFSRPYAVERRIYDFDELNDMDAFEFERFVVEKFGGIPNTKQRGDMGLDGRMPDNTPVQVKQSKNVGRNVIDNFLSAVQRYDEKLFEKNIKEKNTVGYIIAFSFGKGAIEEVARLRNNKNTLMELVKVGDIIAYGTKPKVSLNAEEIKHSEYEFEATAESEVGIDFFAWDFSHDEKAGFKADVMVDKEGKQMRKFTEGEHKIAVEAVDKQGLSGKDKVKIEVKKEK